MMAKGRFDDATIQTVRESADIVAVAGDYTKLERAGKGYKGLSPFKKEKTPSFTVDPEKGLYYCFSTGVGGDAIHLHMQMTGDDFLEAVESLAVRFSVPLPERGASQDGGRQRDTRGALEAGQGFFTRALTKVPDARSYLERRQIPQELVERFGLGYAPDRWDALLNALRERVPVADLEAVGLIGRAQKSGKLYDRFRHRLTFPIHAGSGRLVGFGGRTLGDDKAKYVNTSETDFFHKGRLLYGLHQAKRALRDTRRAILVEGYFDVIGTIAAGIEGAVAGMGTALTSEQAKQLAQMVDEVVVAYDGDEAGEKAFARSLPLLLGAGLSVRRARIPRGSDPDALRLEEGNEALVAAIDQADDAVWLLIQRALPADDDRSPLALDRAALRIVEVLRLLRDPLVRGAYVRRAAERLGVRESHLGDRLAGQAGPIAAAPAGETGASQGADKVLNMEERALAVLLDPATELPDLASLPAPQAFFDPATRNIFEAFCACYRSADSRKPTAAAITAHLRQQGTDLDSTARILLASSVLDDEGSSETIGPADTELSEILGELQRRWCKERLVAVHQEIRQVLEQGDLERFNRLREEKNALTRQLHPDAIGKL